MNNIILKISMFALLISVSMYGWTAGACMPIVKACKANGYYKGGSKEHKALVKDCMLPVTRGVKTLPNTTFSENQLKSCKMDIEQKIKNKL